ncbi:MAG: SDR family oxidoreductase [Synergistaceae bacterium]|jgi:NAD(P)-dependent dehydrogenase (short-subunit alcohol dehydrogenase family)|nr:SDR family oxidoreductase [Synergistaceae bacterium]
MKHAPKHGRLEGRVAAITGASSGIGRKTAEVFAEQGASVAAIDLDESGAKALMAGGGNVRFFMADITSEEDVKKAMKSAISSFGALDILVNCAGVFAEGDVAGTDLVSWRKVMDVNLTGTFLCMKYAIAEMLPFKSGSIINIASEAGIRAIPGQAAYNVSKAAVIMLTKSAARDYAASGIRVNCVCPGRVMTPLVQRIVDESDDPLSTLEKLSSDRPVMRMGTTLDIANACLAFATDEMVYATGSALSVDGGFTL